MGKTWSAEGIDFATLTDIIAKAWSGKSVKQYKKHKDLKKENLRDHMPAYRSDGIPACRHDKLRIGFEHAGRGDHFRDFKKEKASYVG